MRRLLAVALLLALLAGYVAHGPLLAAAGRFLIEEEPPAPADAIVVLSGSVPDRIMEAVALYQGGFAPRLILSEEPEHPAFERLRSLGVALPRPYEVNRTVAERLGVPAPAITVVRGRTESTFSEAQTVLRHVRGQGYGTVLLVTSKLHTRRAASIYRQFAGDGLRIIVRPSRYDRFLPDAWWHDRASARLVIIEYQKWLLYQLVDRWRIRPVTAPEPAEARS